MRPDMEDYAELDEGKQGPSSRAMSWMVLAVAVGGFAALAYYAYHSGNKATAEGETMVVEADQTPIKAAPETPDGEQFPNKDKTIYDVITPNADGSSAKVEKLLPDPEHPVAATNVEDSEDDVPTVTPAAQAAQAPAPAPTAAPAPAAAPVATAPATTTTTFVANTPATGAPQTVNEQPVATVAKPVPEKQPEVAKAPAKSYEAPKMINEKKATAKKEDAAKPATAKPASGAYMVQLGAYASESEAQGAWKKISGKFSLSGAPTIVKADVNGKTFYRLRTGSYASSADAKVACAKLAGQACMPVK